MLVPTMKMLALPEVQLGFPGGNGVNLAQADRILSAAIPFGSGFPLSRGGSKLHAIIGPVAEAKTGRQWDGGTLPPGAAKVMQGTPTCESTCLGFAPFS